MRNLNDYIKNPTHKLIAEAYKNAKTPEELQAAKQYQQELQDQEAEDRDRVRSQQYHTQQRGITFFKVIL